jgi:hypothetical protein
MAYAIRFLYLRAGLIKTIFSLPQLHKILCSKQQGLKFAARQKQISSSNKKFKYLSRINPSYGNL